jgi:hypothetical protein
MRQKIALVAVRILATNAILHQLSNTAFDAKQNSGGLSDISQTVEVIHSIALLTRALTPANLSEEDSSMYNQDNDEDISTLPGKLGSAHNSPHETNPTKTSCSGLSPLIMIGLPLS